MMIKESPRSALLVPGVPDSIKSALKSHPSAACSSPKLAGGASPPAAAGAAGGGASPPAGGGGAAAVVVVSTPGAPVIETPKKIKKLKKFQIEKKI
jgi:hypothetical protein